MLLNLPMTLALERWQSLHLHFQALREMLNISYGCVAVHRLLMAQPLIKR
jgi:hypothetical protein